MRVGILGINHKLADLKLRETLAKACQRRFGPGNSAHGDHKFVLLSTCNRTELYFTSPDLAATHTYILGILRREVGEEFDQKIYTYFCQDCFAHLSRVTAGLDSAIVAETEIQGQVKAAYEKAAAFHEFPGEMHYLFQKCLKLGKKVRSEFPLKPGLPDLGHAMITIGHHMFGNPADAKVLFVGASDINRKIIAFFRSRNIKNLAVCNRSLSSAKELAQAYAMDIHPWAHLGAWDPFDWIIFGTKSPDYLIKGGEIPGGISKKLVIDLCVPRNVDPLLGRHEKITLLNVDQINRTLKIRRQQINHTLIKAELFVADASKKQMEIFKAKERSRKYHCVLTAI